MKIRYGNIWDLHDRAPVVIPTNIGWRKDGSNVMGRGLARQAALKFRGIEEWYGEYCQKHRAKTTCVVRNVHQHLAPLVLFPVKPLNEAAPWVSWKSEANLKLIERSAKDLAALYQEDPRAELVAVPAVGCGNGGRDLGEVRPILERYLTSDRFVLVLETKRRPR